MTRSRSIALLLVLFLAAAACADDEGSPGTTGAATGPSATTGATGPSGDASDSPTASESADGEPGGELEDGRHFGFVGSVDADGRTIAFDRAEFLTGEDANEAAAAEGLETPVPNDYFIVNDEEELSTLGLSPDVELVLLDWSRCCDETFVGELEAFGAAFEDPPFVQGDLIYQGPTSPYWVTVEGGAVTRIEEQYLP